MGIYGYIPILYDQIPTIHGEKSSMCRCFFHTVFMQPTSSSRCCSNLWLVAELPQSSRCGLRSHGESSSFKEGDSQESQTVFWMVKMCGNLLLSPIYIYVCLIWMNPLTVVLATQALMFDRLRPIFVRLNPRRAGFTPNRWRTSYCSMMSCTSAV